MAGVPYGYLAHGYLDGYLAHGYLVRTGWFPASLLP
jgi:hypothetical protein